MSRADWSFLEHLLEEGQKHSTRVGRVWLTVLFLFRMLVLGAAAESAWDDEQCMFVCNTQQPGCQSVCYDRAFPISHFRYFVLQVIFVSTPTIFYYGYVAVRAAAAGDKLRETEAAGGGEAGEGQGGEEEEGEGESQGRATEVVTSARAARDEESPGRSRGGDERRGERGKDGKAEPSQSPELKGRLLGAYTVSVVTTVLLEAGFMAGLWLLYDGFLIAAHYKCVGLPCPHTVDCFVSRPTEKTIFTIYTQAVAGLSLVLNLTELLHLLQLAVSRRLKKRYRRAALPPPPRRSGDHRAAAAGPPAEEAPSYGPVTVEGYPEPPRGYTTADPHPARTEANWGAGRGGGDGDSDIPPSYLNCLVGISSSHSPRAHMHKKHVHHGNGKHRKDNHKGHAKKHYV